jgi:hypothetical protein
MARGSDPDLLQLSAAKPWSTAGATGPVKLAGPDLRNPGPGQPDGSRLSGDPEPPVVRALMDGRRRHDLALRSLLRVLDLLTRPPRLTINGRISPTRPEQIWWISADVLTDQGHDRTARWRLARV